jgi:hypothetical protein
MVSAIHQKLIDRGLYQMAKDGLRSAHFTTPTRLAKHPLVFHTPLIAGNISDIAPGKHMAIAFLHGASLPHTFFTGLEHCVRIEAPGKPLIYVMDNHKMAYFAWHEALVTGHLEKGATLVHIDRHSDAFSPKSLDGLGGFDLAKVVYATRNLLGNSDFIVPAAMKGLIEKFYDFYVEPARVDLPNTLGSLALTHQMADREYVTERYERDRLNTDSTIHLPKLIEELNAPKKFILDLDVDAIVKKIYREGLPTHEDFNRMLLFLAECASKAGVVTIATSPGYADQRVAISFARMLTAEILG